MRHTSTHTYAILQVSAEAYKEIRELLEKAGYQDQFHAHDGGEVIDMHGIALQEHPGRCKHTNWVASNPSTPNVGEYKVCNASLVRCPKCGTKWCLDHQPNPLVCPQCGDRPSANLKPYNSVEER